MLCGVTWHRLPAPTVQIAMCALVTSEAYLATPANPEDVDLPLHEVLQQFAWTEEQAPKVWRERGLPREPLFCFETALKSSYISMHMYRHFRVRRCDQPAAAVGVETLAPPPARPTSLSRVHAAGEHGHEPRCSAGVV